MMTIILVTGILLLVILRARHLLVKSTVEATASHDLSRFFAPAIADQIIHSETPMIAGQGSIRPAVIVFCDIRGFSRLSTTIDPNELMCILKDYGERMGRVIQFYGGSIDKFMGDGIMATFGAASPCDAYAADAINALDELNREIDKWCKDRIAIGKPALAVGFAVAHGDVVFGAVGLDDRLDYTVIGSTVNLAAKLEKHNKKAGVRGLASEDLIDLAITQGYLPPQKDRRVLLNECVEGLSDPIDLVVLEENPKA
jgi:adenylate cyclase